MGQESDSLWTHKGEEMDTSKSNIFVKNSSRVSSVWGSLLITISLVVLKLFKVIDWNWWWVVSPIIIQIVFGTLVLFVRDNARRLKGDD